jgi:hypothetical protein
MSAAKCDGPRSAPRRARQQTSVSAVGIYELRLRIDTFLMDAFGARRRNAPQSSRILTRLGQPPAAMVGAFLSRFPASTDESASEEAFKPRAFAAVTPWATRPRGSGWLRRAPPTRGGRGIEIFRGFGAIGPMLAGPTLAKSVQRWRVRAAAMRRALPRDRLLFLKLRRACVFGNVRANLRRTAEPPRFSILSTGQVNNNPVPPGQTGVIL